MNYYIYYSYEPFGRGYIGCRRCECDPKEDVTYFGSFRDKTFEPTEKIILETFESYELALRAEIELHNFFEVSTNSHFANKVKQTSTGFTTEGTQRSEETVQKHRETIKQNPHKYGHGNSMRGRKHSEETKKKMSETTKKQVFTEETKQKMSRSAKLRIHTPEENQKISQTLRSRPKVSCSICGKVVSDFRLSLHQRIHEKEK